ncbi:type I-B CRISPR-associated protein Cas7/Csh2 [Thermodesulfobium sp. 4217-1]|uniref:type I-B CRISPR-associated protein Cas7/Csh2 n=1 Tax=Thermodesulfobium sp. 4217-1 TaxID=3120013 RepID=UPI0032218BBE
MILDKKSELLFCYDVTDANPNGDPADENRPRIDEETKINIVTDVRLKRTIRDYLIEYKGYDGTNGKDIFVRELPSKEGGIQDAKERARDFGENQEKVLEQCIDVRLFGGVIPLKEREKGKKNDESREELDNKSNSITFTGPVQFKIGRSLNKIDVKYLKGTGAFASKAGKGQATFREEYVLPYSFITFYGIINETAARKTNMSEDDSNELIDAMWNGTKNLISRSKFGQMPRFLLKVDYNEKGYFIGDLDKMLKIKDFTNEFAIRSLSDFTLDISELVKVLENSTKVSNVYYKIDDKLRLSCEIPQKWIELPNLG